MFPVRVLAIGMLVHVAASKLAAQEKNAVDEIRALRNDLKQALQLIAERDAVILKLQNEAARFKTEALAERARAEALQVRAEFLLKRVEELSKELVIAKVGATAGEGGRTPKRNPPEVLMKGKVVKLDDKTPDLIVISLGADNGLKKGHTLECFRLKPPTYLGTIRIIEVQDRTAVGQIQRNGLARRIPVRVGDEVSSQLTSPE